MEVNQCRPKCRQHNFAYKNSIFFSHLYFSPDGEVHVEKCKPTVAEKGNGRIWVTHPRP